MTISQRAAVQALRQIHVFADSSVTITHNHHEVLINLAAFGFVSMAIRKKGGQLAGFLSISGSHICIRKDIAFRFVPVINGKIITRLLSL